MMVLRLDTKVSYKNGDNNNPSNSTCDYQTETKNPPDTTKNCQYKRPYPLKSQCMLVTADN